MRNKSDPMSGTYIPTDQPFKQIEMREFNDFPVQAGWLTERNYVSFQSDELWDMYAEIKIRSSCFKSFKHYWDPRI